MEKDGCSSRLIKYEIGLKSYLVYLFESEKLSLRKKWWLIKIVDLRAWHWKSSQNCTSRRRVQFENFQNITSDHNSRNARAGSYDFLFIIFSTKLLKRATLYALRTTLNASMVSNMLTFIWTNQKCNVETGKSSVKFLKDFEKKSENISENIWKIWRFPGVYIATSVLHSPGYNLDCTL